ncbi:tyrosine-protein phosphatase non-receptor type 61F-like [Tropilaelaps mercedesae]|uniref:protein-tyrosine-phosphatase n=1 Tax=Tropilaelaps mercedesae TaxID=418985 RepID=A0A1V9XSF7_9ACAR|nr:tyrosine-protein phosphatase non-receptor type 61F-like [Tropilaelaps mercedesae]
MAIDFGRKALSKLSGFLSSAKISRCASPPHGGHRDDQAAGGLGVRGGQTGAAAGGMEAEFDEIDNAGDWPRLFALLRTRGEPSVVSGPAAASRYQAAKKSDNQNLNRYTDVLPFDHSRVVLSRGSVDYINANQVDYERARRSYILTQGPLEETVGHFWLMVWEQRVPVIIMLNKIIEKQRLKCHKYWPDADEPIEIDELQLNVELLSEDETESYVRRTMRLSDSKSGDSREVIQFQYTEWPDFGIPQRPDDFLQFLELVRGSDLLSGGENDKEKGPPVIHCSAGIGRSGTFCLVDIVLKMFEDGTVKDNGDIDIQEILLSLRKSRTGLIQTPDQLKFAYIVLIEAFKRKRGEGATTFGDAGARNDNKEPMEIEPPGCNGDLRHTGGRPHKATKKKTEADLEATFEHGDDDGDEVHDDDDEIVVHRSDRSLKVSAGMSCVADARTNDTDRATETEAKCSNSSSSEHMNTNGPELDAETTQEGAGDQRDEELQTETEGGDDGSENSGGEDEGSSPQKRAHHRLSLNNSDSKEEPILKRTKSQDE